MPFFEIFLKLEFFFKNSVATGSKRMHVRENRFDCVNGVVR